MLVIFIILEHCDIKLGWHYRRQWS